MKKETKKRRKYRKTRRGEPKMNDRKRGKDGWAEEKPLLARKSCSFEREFLENREKLVIKAQGRKKKKRRRKDKRERERERVRESETERRVGKGDESCRLKSRQWKCGSLGCGGRCEGSEREVREGRVTQENAWKCIPRSEGAGSETER
jgi:hypothetical protein